MACMFEAHYFLGGKVYDTLVSRIDLFPTICDLLQIPYPAWLQGTSLLPLMQGDIEQVHACSPRAAAAHSGRPNPCPKRRNAFHPPHE